MVLWTLYTFKLGIFSCLTELFNFKGQFISAIVPGNTTTTDMAGPITIPFMIFGGYFLNNE